MKKDRNALVLYSTATCNLNCRYCYIDKNPSLVKIDQLLDDSFQNPDYYLDFAKEVFYKEKLNRIEIWGGEPSMRLDRVYATVNKLIDYFPNLHEFMMSTNLTLDNFLDQFFGFLNILGQYPERNFTFYLQLSLDGPKHINDLNRGKGVTEAFAKNFVKLVTSVGEILNKYPNIIIHSHFKPTLDGSSIKMLQTKESIIKYYQFLESFKKIVDNHSENYRFTFEPGIPNTACPSPHTVEEGILFANLVKLTRQIEKENITEKYFSYYKSITPFGWNRLGQDCDLRNCGICGTGRSVIGLLPNKIISTCHNGFTELLSDYKKYCIEHIEEVDRTIDFNLFVNGHISNSMVFPYEKLSQYEKQIEDFYDMEQNFLLEHYIATIQFLAICEQVDKKYLNYENAENAAKFIYGRTSICIRDNIGSTGTKYLLPVGLFKLLLNGAMDNILLEGEKV